jgi:hypothetical protein
LIKKSSGRQVDAAEQWLRDNDPEYASRSQTWRTPRTDALERQADGQRPHDSLADLTPVPDRRVRVLVGSKRGVPGVIGSGHYRRSHEIDDGETP